MHGLLPISCGPDALENPPRFYSPDCQSPASHYNSIKSDKQQKKRELKFPLMLEPVPLQLSVVCALGVQAPFAS